MSFTGIFLCTRYNYNSNEMEAQSRVGRVLLYCSLPQEGDGCFILLHLQFRSNSGYSSHMLRLLTFPLLHLLHTCKHKRLIVMESAHRAGFFRFQIQIRFGSHTPHRSGARQPLKALNPFDNYYHTLTHCNSSESVKGTQHWCTLNPSIQTHFKNAIKSFEAFQGFWIMYLK